MRANTVGGSAIKEPSGGRKGLLAGPGVPASLFAGTQASTRPLSATNCGHPDLAPKQAWANPSSPLRKLAFGLVLLAISGNVLADYVSTAINRIYMDPASQAVVADGYQLNDEISFIFETNLGSIFVQNNYLFKISDRKEARFR